MMKVCYTGWTWIKSHEPEAAKEQLAQSFKECKFLGYDYVENFAFIRDFYKDNPEELVQLQKDCGVSSSTSTATSPSTWRSRCASRRSRSISLAAVGGKWYNCQNGGFGDDGPSERPTNPEMIDKMCAIVNELGAYAKERGVTVCFHPHYGTCVFSQSDIDYFAAHTKPGGRLPVH